MSNSPWCCSRHFKIRDVFALFSWKCVIYVLRRPCSKSILLHLIYFSRIPWIQILVPGAAIPPYVIFPLFPPSNPSSASHPCALSGSKPRIPDHSLEISAGFLLAPSPCRDNFNAPAGLKELPGASGSTVCPLTLCLGDGKAGGGG